VPSFKTLAEAIANIGSLYPKNGFTFQDEKGKEVTFSFPEIANATAARAVALQQLGLAKGDRLGLIVIDPEHFVLTFLAAIRIGVVPVPVYPPRYLGGLDSYFQQTESILNSASAKALAVSSKLRELLSRVTGNVRTLTQIVEVEKLCDLDTGGDFKECTILPEDLVFLQYTSGSTMEPRGVMITHHCLISNIKAFLSVGLEGDPHRDKGVSFLPLYHDMGLVGFVLAPIFWGISVVFIPTLRFVKNANVWMETIHAHRGTISFAPNFAYALAVRKASATGWQAWDLSCVKVLGCGAEPIHPETLRDFVRLGGKYRLSPDCILPAYGMAESTLAVTMKPLHDPVRFRSVERTTFEKTGIAIEASDGVGPILEHVSCGVPFPGHEVAIMDSDGKCVDDCVEGEICLRGPSTAAGYIGNPESWQAMQRNGWLRTGDLGYFADNELYVTGRIKDLIIVNGHNIHPQTIEWLAAKVAGVKKGCVAAFSRPGPQGEELVIVVEARTGDNTRMISEIAEAVQRAILIAPADIVCLKQDSLPRTSSGKLKRHQIRQRYLTDTAR